MSLKTTPASSTEDSTSELPKKLQVPYKFNGDYEAKLVPAYTTNVPGLVVAKTHKIKHDLIASTMDLVALSGAWDIVLYPYGEQLLGPFTTKSDALTVVDELAKWNWVSFYQSDVKRNNDMTELKKAVMDIKVRYGV